MKLEFVDRFSKNYQILNFTKNLSLAFSSGCYTRVSRSEVSRAVKAHRLRFEFTTWYIHKERLTVLTFFLLEFSTFWRKLSLIHCFLFVRFVIEVCEQAQEKKRVRNQDDAKQSRKIALQDEGSDHVDQEKHELPLPTKSDLVNQWIEVQQNARTFISNWHSYMFLLKKGHLQGVKSQNANTLITNCPKHSHCI